ncbi:MAG: group II intron reverse transcriptase/maturase [Cyanobacteria bacterium P01_A01_bin.83]
MQINANVTERILDWHNIDWYSVYRNIRNLRRRIFKATQLNNWRKVRNLQKLMLRSFSNVLESVRKVTIVNKGSKTAGLDKVLVKTPEQRLALSYDLAFDHRTKAIPAKRVLIPKKNGKLRPLGIPVIRDRCLQAIVKNALEPCWEAQFEGISYGFRPGRSTHDAIGKIYLIARPNKTKKWVVDADIKGCFDNIDHDKLLEIIGNFPYRHLIKKWLKSGYVDSNVFHAQNSGTPQGSIISPLLANIALHGMEKALDVKYNNRGNINGDRCLVRYADDFVIFCKTKEDAELAMEEINQWLSTRGLSLSIEKTKIVHLTDGFDFLGFNIRHYKVKDTKTGFKLLIKPSKEFLKKTRDDIREVFLHHIGKPLNVLIGKINPIIRGKANYLNKVVSSKEFNSLDFFIFNRQVRYVKRTHPNKPKYWWQDKYWGRLNLSRPNDKWVFGDKKSGNYIIKFAWTKIKRHSLVVKRSSPDDPALKEYWENRNKKSDKLDVEIFNKNQAIVAGKQDFKCPVCGQTLFNNEPLHLHHIIPRNKGGKDKVNNLVFLHLYCHHKTHYQER